MMSYIQIYDAQETGEMYSVPRLKRGVCYAIVVYKKIPFSIKGGYRVLFKALN